MAIYATFEAHQSIDSGEAPIHRSFNPGGLNMQDSTTNFDTPYLTEKERDVLIDIAVGLTDRAIAERRYLSRRGVTSRLHSLYRKLRISIGRTPKGAQLYNLRNRAVAVAFLHGLLTRDTLRQHEQLWQKGQEEGGLRN